MEEIMVQVYVQVDNNIITRIESSISSSYIGFSNGWIQIDEGVGDKYSHAQGNYLEKGLMDSDGKYNYKLIDGVLIELMDEEKETLFPIPVPQPTELDRLKDLEIALAEMLGV